MDPEPGASFYIRMAERLEADGLCVPADRMAAVARRLSWQPKPEQPTRCIGRWMLMPTIPSGATWRSGLGVWMADAGRKSKKEARYVDKSAAAGERCGNCSMFREPGMCSLVQGRIDRAGWCRYWKAKVA